MSAAKKNTLLHTAADRLKTKKGETLIESLVSLLIVVTIMVMLPSAVVIAAKFNAEAKNANNITSCTMQREASNKLTGENKIQVVIDGGTPKDYAVDAYNSEGFYFYDQH